MTLVRRSTKCSNCDADEPRRYVDFLATLSDDDLDTETVPVDAPGWPPSVSFSVRQCLRVVLNEEWEHRRYVERDFDVAQSQ